LMCRTYCPLPSSSAFGSFRADPSKKPNCTWSPDGVHVGHVCLASNPAPVPPLHGLLESRGRAFHEPPQLLDDRLVPWDWSARYASKVAYTFMRFIAAKVSPSRDNDFPEKKARVCLPGPGEDDLASTRAPLGLSGKPEKPG
jgi:hypothetical protein